jgi:hypothetical protein
MRILELENRCTGNRTVGSNPTLSARDLRKSSLSVGAITPIDSSIANLLNAINRDRV